MKLEKFQPMYVVFNVKCHVIVLNVRYFNVKSEVLLTEVNGILTCQLRLYCCVARVSVGL